LFGSGENEDVVKTEEKIKTIITGLENYCNTLLSTDNLARGVEQHLLTPIKKQLTEVEKKIEIANNTLALAEATLNAGEKSSLSYEF